MLQTPENILKQPILMLDPPALAVDELDVMKLEVKS